MAPSDSNQRAKRQRIGADDLVGADRIARHHHLVAGRQDRDARPAMDQQPRPVHRRGEADVAGVEAPTGREADRAGAEIEPGRADIAAPGCAFLDQDDVAFEPFGVFLDDDAVGPARHRRAGEDAHRLADAARCRQRTGPPAPIRSRAAAPARLRHRRRARHSRPSPRHRQGRLGAARRHVLGEDPAERLAQRHLLGRQAPTGAPAAASALPRPKSW